MKHEPHSSRRRALLEKIGDGVAIVPTAPERIRNRDSHHPYRFDSYFWYLTGFPEPEAVIVLVGGRQKKSILFCRDKNEEREVWEGFRYGPDAARDASTHRAGRHAIARPRRPSIRQARARPERRAHLSRRASLGSQRLRKGSRQPRPLDLRECT